MNRPTIVKRQFVSVAGRMVHLRYAGSGPAVLLLHQSPQSSRTLVPWIERLCTRYAVFAPDTPGFGYSDPLSFAAPEIPDFAAALAGLIRTLAIGPVVVWGVHTGAVTALRLGLDFPELVAGVVCDGYARFDATEREALLAAYLPPFEPQWDGGHLHWLFARLREQHLFFPWHDGSVPARLGYPPPTAAHTHLDVMDVLDAGDGYRAGYRAPFLYDDATAAARLTVPAAIFYRSADVLAPHINRLPDLPAHVQAETVPGGPAALVERTDAAIARFSVRACSVDAAAAIGLQPVKTAERRIAVTTHGEIALRRVRGGGTTDLLVLHDLGRPARIPVNRDQFREVLVPDLPGHGASNEWSPTAFAPEQIAHALKQLMDGQEVGVVQIVAEGASAAVAAALALSLGDQCIGLTLRNPLVLEATARALVLEGLPDTIPVPGGGHLAAAWQWARTRYLFWPWLPGDGGAARSAPAPAPRRVHADVVEILRAGPGFRAMWSASLAFNLAGALAALHCPIRIEAEEDTEWQRMAAQLAALLDLVPAADSSGTRQWTRAGSDA